MPNPDSEAVVREFFEKVINNGDENALKKLVHAQGVGHVGGDPEPRKGPKGVLKGLSAFKSASPDFRVTVNDIFSSGDKVAIRWTGKGKHQSHFEGIAETGKTVTLSGVDIYKVADGKIVEGWHYPDQLSMVRQLGSMPLGFLK